MSPGHLLGMCPVMVGQRELPYVRFGGWRWSCRHSVAHTLCLIGRITAVAWGSCQAGLPTIPSSWGPSFRFSNSWVMSVFRFMMKDLGFCRKSTPSRFRSNENLHGSRTSLWAPAHRVASSLSLFTLSRSSLPWLHDSAGKERSQLYKVYLTSYHNCVELNSCTTSYNMYIYISTHIHVLSPGSGSLIESWLVIVDCKHAYLADSDSFFLAKYSVLLSSFYYLDFFFF